MRGGAEQVAASHWGQNGNQKKAVFLECLSRMPGVYVSSECESLFSCRVREKRRV